MFKIIAIVVVVLLAALLVYAATKPDTFRVQRSASIKAPPEKIFALINDLHSWGAWSPWEKMDPAMKRTHRDRKSTRLNSSHGYISYAVFCLKKKKIKNKNC